MTDAFYQAFEERHRGSREVIKSRFKQYLPFIEPLARKYPGTSAVDAGCGRGEWLELMNEVGLAPYGVDLDDGMLAACVELGLPADKVDAISYIAKLPNDSQLVVSAFHVVEHLQFDQLRTLVREALRVLKPGGLLIMETPNPENIAVATRNFYLDPTHQRPIPPQLLSFVAEYYGFALVKVLRLQESAELRAGNAVSLLDLFNGVSPDYAVVAQKGGDDGDLAVTKPAFEGEYGLTFNMLVDRYQRQSATVSAQTEARAAQAEATAQQAETRAAQAEATAQQAETRAAQAELTVQRAAARAALAEAVAEQRKQELVTVYSSSTWQTASALRSASRSVREFFRGVRARLGLKSKSTRLRSGADRTGRPGTHQGEARRGLKQRIVAAAQRLGRSWRKLYDRVVARRPPSLAAESVSHALGSGVSTEGMTPWTRTMAARLGAARVGKRAEA